MNNDELIQKARDFCKAANAEKSNGNVVDSAALSWAITHNFVPQLCDALEAAEKEIDRLNKRIETLESKQCDSDHENMVLAARAEKAEEDRDEVVADFQDFATSGIHNMNPYCGNRSTECTDGRGWCVRENCKGFCVRAATPPEGE